MLMVIKVNKILLKVLDIIPLKAISIRLNNNNNTSIAKTCEN